MIVKTNPEELIKKMEKVRTDLEDIVDDYLRNYADYGWDSVSEDLSCMAAQIYKDEILLKNAEIK